MKKNLFTLLLVLAPLFCSLAQLRLPQSSPAASVTQTIGLTEVTVKYHAPGVKGREVWGKMVPYGKIWRCGANEATLISFNDTVRINGESVPPGEYSLFILPETQSKWYGILNKNTKLWGTEGYQDTLDILRVKIQAQPAPFNETLQYTFSNIKTNSAQLNLNWEKLSLSFNIEVDTFEKAIANIKQDLAKAKSDDWSIYAQAAQYLIQHNVLHEQALIWINKSLALKENFLNNWLKAQLLAQKDEFQEAVNLAKKAMKLGQNDTKNYMPLAPEMERSVEIWKVKMHASN